MPALALAIGGAVATAPAWLPWVIPVVILLVLVFAAGVFLEKPLVYLLGKVPVVGGTIADLVGRGIGGLVSLAQSWAAAAAKPFLDFVMSLVSGMTAAYTTAIAGTEAAMDAIKSVQNATADAIGRRIAAEASLAGRIGNIFYTLGGATLALLAAKLGIDVLRSTTIPHAQAAATANANAYTVTRVSAESAARTQAVAAARAELLVKIAAVQAADQAAVKSLSTTLAGYRATTEVRIRGIEEGLRDLSDVRVPAIESELTTIRDVTIPKVIADERAATATLTATVETIAADVACLNPLCASGYSGLVNQLLQGAELLALLELVGAAVRDPDGTARMVSGVAQGVAQDASALLSPVMGVQL